MPETVFIDIGQVWIEDVVSKHGDQWQTLHFVTDLVEYYSGDIKSCMVIHNCANRQCVNTPLDRFKHFKRTNYTVDVSIPCVEQLTLDDLERLSKGVRLHEPNQKLLPLANSLIEALDEIKKVGGSSRYWDVVTAIKILADVSTATGVDSSSVRRNLWSKGID